MIVASKGERALVLSARYFMERLYLVSSQKERRGKNQLPFSLGYSHLGGGGQ